MNRNDSDMVDEIVRMLSGDLSDAEIKAFQQRCRDDVQFGQCYAAMKKIWDNSSSLEVAKRINSQCDEQWAMFRRNCFGKEQHQAKGFIRSRFFQVAAIVIPLFTLGAIGFLFTPQLMESTWHQMATNDFVDTVRLDDQSMVVLNKASRIKYQLSGQKRLVRLDGMAYFKVSKDAARPFVVRLNRSEVKVLGTEFFIENIKDRDRVVVEVTGGRVEFGNDQQKVILVKGQKAVFEDGTISMGNYDSSSSAGWERGKLSFQSASLPEVLEVLMKNYPEIKKVNRNGLMNDSVKVTTVFDNQPLSDVLDELKIHFNKKIQFNDGELTITD